MAVQKSPQVNQLQASLRSLSQLVKLSQKDLEVLKKKLGLVKQNETPYTGEDDEYADFFTAVPLHRQPNLHVLFDNDSAVIKTLSCMI